MRYDRLRPALRRLLPLLLWSACALLSPLLAATPGSGTDLAAVYEAQVDRRLELPEADRRFYAAKLAAALFDVGLYALPPEYFVLVDENPHVQAVMVFWLSPAREFEFVGFRTVMSYAKSACRSRLLAFEGVLRRRMSSRS